MIDVLIWLGIYFSLLAAFIAAIIFFINFGLAIWNKEPRKFLTGAIAIFVSLSLFGLCYSFLFHLIFK